MSNNILTNNKIANTTIFRPNAYASLVRPFLLTNIPSPLHTTCNIYIYIYIYIHIYICIYKSVYIYIFFHKQFYFDYSAQYLK